MRKNIFSFIILLTFLFIPLVQAAGLDYRDSTTIRFPPFKSIETMTVEDLKPYAEALSANPEAEDLISLIKPGDKVLIHGHSNSPMINYQSATVLESVRRFLKERYNAIVDVILTDEKGRGLTKDMTMDWVRFAAEKEGYAFYIGSNRGPNNRTSAVRNEFAKRFGYKWMGKIEALRDPYTFISERTIFPGELWVAIGKKVQKQVYRKRNFEITDPTGSWIRYSVPDVVWKNYERPDDLSYYQHVYFNMVARNPNPQAEGVLISYGYHNGDGYLANTKWDRFAGALVEPITWVIKGGKVVEVKGGGAYGNLVRQSVEMGKNYAVGDLYPGPGVNWCSEFPTIGTNPKAYPVPTKTSDGRLRAGIIHISMDNRGGSSKTTLTEEESKKIYHTDIELYHATMIADGEVIINKGWLTALDDPEIIALAKKYGDPKELFRYVWVPDPKKGPVIPEEWLKGFPQEISDKARPTK